MSHILGGYCNCRTLQIPSRHCNTLHDLEATGLVTHCSTLEHSATHCNTLQYTATHSFKNLNIPGGYCTCHTPQYPLLSLHLFHCSTLQHTEAHCNTPKHTATHCSTLQHTAAHCSNLQHPAPPCNTLQHTATHCNTPHLEQVGTRQDSMGMPCGQRWDKKYFSYFSRSNSHHL